MMNSEKLDRLLLNAKKAITLEKKNDMTLDKNSMS